MERLMARSHRVTTALRASSPRRNCGSRGDRGRTSTKVLRLATPSATQVLGPDAECYEEDAFAHPKLPSS